MWNPWTFRPLPLLIGKEIAGAKFSAGSIWSTGLPSGLDPMRVIPGQIYHYQAHLKQKAHLLLWLIEFCGFLYSFLQVFMDFSRLHHIWKRIFVQKVLTVAVIHRLWSDLCEFCGSLQMSRSFSEMFHLWLLLIPGIIAYNVPFLNSAQVSHSGKGFIPLLTSHEAPQVVLRRKSCSISSYRPFFFLRDNSRRPYGSSSRQASVLLPTISVLQ